MSNLKLGVEVIRANNLLPKDEDGSSSPFVELYFDGQMLQTTTKVQDLNPVWNEPYYFDIPDPSNLISLTLDVNVYHKIGDTNSSVFLGKVALPGTLFVPYSDAVALYHPLEQRGLFSSVRGKLCLKVFVTDDRTVKSPMPIPKVETSPNKKPNSTEAKAQPTLHSATNTSLHDKSVAPGGVIHGDNTAKTYNLVERIYFLYVRVVKARDLPMINFIGSIAPFVEVNFGKYRGFTEHLDNKRDPEWNQVFAFSRERMQAFELEVVIKHKDLVKDDLVGNVRFDINEVPLILSPEISLAPEWYQLEDKNGEKIKGELMLAVWIGTQADKAFPDAWHADAATPFGCTPAVARVICSKVYHAPRLWFLRVNVIEGQDLFPTKEVQSPNIYVKIKLVNTVLRTRICNARTSNPIWNEDLLFVAAEPFEDHLIISVEDNVAQGEDEIIGMVIIPLNYMERRGEYRYINSRWFNLERPVSVNGDQLKKKKFSSRIRLQACLEGGYNVLAESPQYSSDYRPLARQLWRPSIGILELGILNAEWLVPMKIRDGRGTSDTYCVAKYGQKWVRTRTIAGNLCPIFNEQYTWEVFDLPTVLTIGVFENNQLLEGKINDQKIGKVRIRISTLDAGRVYTHSYPLLVIHPTGVKKMGVLHLAIRFSCTNYMKMLYQYSQPLLPKMHYKMPFTVTQLDMLRRHALSTVAMRLGRAEPPLRKEVVEYMCEVESDFWSMRRSKANFFRLISVFSGVLAAGKWFEYICNWRNPITTVLTHVLFLMLVCFPALILPALFLYMFLIGIWNYRYRQRYPLHMNTRISHAESVQPDELDEEFDTFPTSRSPDLVRMRYDRLRSVAGRIQTVVGNFATQGERFQALLSWRDPRATAIFVVFCLTVTLVFSLVKLQVIAALAGFYVMRHPIFRDSLPSIPLNFFRRIPTRADSLL